MVYMYAGGSRYRAPYGDKESVKYVLPQREKRVKLQRRNSRICKSQEAVKSREKGENAAEKQ